MSRSLAVVLLTLLLAACASGGGRDKQPPQRPAGARPVTLNLPTSRETKACYADLSREDVSYSPLPDRDFGGGCQIVGALQLLDIGIPVTNLRAMRCGLARSFSGWVEHAVVPAAHQMLGSDLVRIESMGTYACRNVVGTKAAYAARRSGHATANAVDVSGFVLQDGRRITIQGGWNNPDPNIRAFLRTIRASACRRFGTVLSPDYNAVHYNHLHIEDDRAGFCR
ncbi:extensin family protein [Sphingomonas sp. CARO-RG-8B-R24-01]|uniref:extensin family protein n=1 Tax=Sphingomonas sp. CARO-RG-8B-R24-01 TaxID=2914831 RepID=UPI001F57CA00|nr:extensin family protein [Sphingomonas sp. CARO-RG-8B-R24-01]